MAERGRPRAFDRDEALRRAMRLFWTCGYEGTSIADLTAAMGINKPSLYAAFGCKEALFREAVSLYDRVESQAVTQALRDAPTGRDAVEALLRVNVAAYSDPEKPAGCMVVLAALLGTPENESLRAALAENRRQGQEALRRRLEQDVAAGALPPGTDTARLAAFYTTVLQGLSVQARDGASRAALEAIVDAALAAWDRLLPSAPPRPLSPSGDRGGRGTE